MTGNQWECYVLVMSCCVWYWKMILHHLETLIKSHFNVHWHASSFFIWYEAAVHFEVICLILNKCILCVKRDFTCNRLRLIDTSVNSWPDLKFLQFFHCSNPEPTSNFEAVTSGTWPGCCSGCSTLLGSRWKQGLARGKESLSASGNARKK